MNLGETEYEIVEQINQDQDRDQWQALVIAVKNLPSSTQGRGFLV
jgi:hypothetical protein